MSEDLARTSQTPIEFYGRVVDQHGAPIAEVKATASVKADTFFLENHQDQYSTTTDDDGRFQFTSLHGQDMGLRLFKEGYEYKSNFERYEYSELTPERRRHHPDPAAPVVFTMWKQQGAEPLVHMETIQSLGVPVDGTPAFFDLITGRKRLAGGDLVVRLTRQPEHIQRGRPFDWRAVIEAPGGGIIEQNDEYPNEAPAEGYKEQCVIDMPVTSPHWQDSVRRGFYVKIHGSKLYGRLRLEITADYEPPPTAVDLEVWINPSGSRNLEYDPHKQAPNH